MPTLGTEKVKVPASSVFRHNHECDAKLWFGELALDGFEQFIFNDEIMEPVLFNAYDDFINHAWPEFVEDNSYS